MSTNATPNAPATHARPLVLIVDDDPDVAAVLVRYLGANGFATAVAPDAERMRAALASQDVALVLLDLGLPDADGLDVTRELAASWKGPVIIVTGRGDAVDRVVGLELGADDYVTKPFDLRELLARMRSVLRRAEPASATPAASAPSAERGGRLAFAGFVFDPAARTLADPAGRDVPLTSGEFELLAVLLAQPNHVLSRDQLMTRLHGREAGPYDRAIDVQVGRLRKKIEADPQQPAIVKSVRGAGYVLAARVERT